MKMQKIQKSPCHYHEFQYIQLDFARDYEANEDFLNHFQNLFIQILTKELADEKFKLQSTLLYPNGIKTICKRQSVPNWRTAIPGAPMDFRSWTTSSVITPCHADGSQSEVQDTRMTGTKQKMI